MDNVMSIMIGVVAKASTSIAMPISYCHMNNSEVEDITSTTATVEELKNYKIADGIISNGMRFIISKTIENDDGSRSFLNQKAERNDIILFDDEKWFVETTEPGVVELAVVCRSNVASVPSSKGEFEV